MIVQSSTVSMGSQRTYAAYKAETVSYSSWGKTQAISADTAATMPQATDSKQNTVFLADSFDTSQLYATNESFTYEGEDKTTFEGLQSLLELMWGKAQTPKKTDWKDLFQKIVKQQKERLEALYEQIRSSTQMGSQSGGQTQMPLTISLTMPTQQFGMTATATDVFAEQEVTTFYSAGKVVTEDGRTIDFSQTVEMSRSFLSYASVDIDYQAAYMIDPLVISMGSDTTEVRDQTFLFDIDADGEKDNISLLGELCGFLAYDENGDGVINDGKELFGAKTGDGFAELAVFDADANGWIDENDPIFNRLRIWTKDADGNDKLVALGIAGVGAIYLGNAATKFSVTDSENQTAAQIKTTGVYLREDGTAGTIQQVDFAVK